MTIWYVHRNGGNAIVSANTVMQPGYATEALDDASNAEIQAYLITATAVQDPSSADNLQKGLKAVLLASAVLSGKATAQAKAAFAAAWNALP